MLLALFCISYLVAASVANPFHKFPFVFLLDVGNEELEKTNTEQIRVSIPGGSLAIRYPAFGDGGVISHVRVSGIDFGTDLKANIIDGGPGYKYVVLVFLGNTGIPYDAVVTLKTVTSNMDPDTNKQNLASDVINDNSNSYRISEESDINNSAEETDDNLETTVNKISNIEQANLSSNVYNYAQTDEDNSINGDASDETKDIYAGSLENEDTYKEDTLKEADGDELSNNKFESERENQYRAEELQAESNEEFDYSKYSNNDNLFKRDKIDQSVSLDEDAKMYRQDTLYDAQGHDNTYSAEDLELDQMFNDEEVHNDADKYKDSNNNNFDPEYDSAVAY